MAEGVERVVCFFATGPVSSSAIMAAASDYDRLRRAIAGERLPCALVDLRALDANLARLVAAVAGRGKTIRVATKSVRCPALLRRILDRGAPVCRGLLCMSVAEAVRLADEGFEDVLVGYPSAQPEDARALAEAVARGRPIRIVVDARAHLEALARAARERGAAAAIEAVIEVDPSLRPLGLAHLGPRRSPVRGPADVGALCRAARELGGVRIVGLMAYEALVAGLPDLRWIVRFLKRRAVRAAARARAAAVDALRAEGVALPLVNGGGTGSLATTAADPVVTEVTVGSGFLAPHLFDHYRGLALEPAAFFALPVARVPGPGFVTCRGGGLVASGPPGRDRLPRPWLPTGLALVRAEGAGEIQTPLATRRSAVALAPGDPVFFRHAKAGELAEHFGEYLLVDGDRIVARAPTYRGAVPGAPSLV